MAAEEEAGQQVRGVEAEHQGQAAQSRHLPVRESCSQLARKLDARRRDQE